ncbi:MAG: class I adenylate-forming enzyme family protein [Thermodesulfobacteriota bacterium]
MLINDFSLENVEVDGYPIQTFKNRFRTLWSMFLQSTSTYRDGVYLIEGPQKMTFRQAADSAVGLAALLKDHFAAGRDDRIGILMENSINFILAFWAIQNLGATAVIFNTRLAVPELQRQLQFSELKVLLSSPLMASKVKEIPEQEMTSPLLVFNQALFENLPQGQNSPPLDHGSEDDTAVILFTSGTSGRPKGVMLTHRNLITCAFRSGATLARGLALTASSSPVLDRSNNQYMLIVAPLFHIMAIEQMVAGVFLGRGCILLKTFNPQEILDLIQQGVLYGLTGTPTMYWLLLNKTSIRESKILNLRRLGFGAAPMAPDLLKELREVFPSARLRNGYGLTEAPSISALPDLYMETHPTSVGKPTLCTEVKIVDPETREEVGIHSVGELAVRGALVTKGYYKAPEETAKVYHQGWFFTGDMAYRDAEGFISLVGRSREMINRGGENVYPVEVENVLHLHPKILDVAVFGLPDPVMASIVVCAVIPRPGTGKITLQEIQADCRDQLASYKIPQKVFFLREMPTNPGGKVMKNELIEQFREKKSGE